MQTKLVKLHDTAWGRRRLDRVREEGAPEEIPEHSRLTTAHTENRDLVPENNAKEIELLPCLKHTEPL